MLDLAAGAYAHAWKALVGKGAKRHLWLKDRRKWAMAAGGILLLRHDGLSADRQLR
ncbi:hypothetical protein [Niveispirillum sp. KHB5.9]|uniref:hypothetical protein n=1 Tax=Niveispirillum sp. KHB5.9 TaxID=3400269 RepID=UPI003A86BEB6